MVIGPVTDTVDCAQLFLDTVAGVECVVHVAGLLELATTKEHCLAIFKIRLGVMGRACYPSDVVFVIEIAACLGFFIADELHTIVVDKDVGGTALHLVGADCLFDGDYRRLDNSRETFFVYGHLEGDMGQRVQVTIKPLGWLPAVVFAVIINRADGTEDLEQIAGECLEEEL